MMDRINGCEKLIIPSSFEECLTYEEQLMYLFISKQDQLVAGDGIRMRRNDDGTVTITSTGGSSGGREYTIEKTETENETIYNLVDVFSQEAVGDNIVVPKAIDGHDGVGIDDITGVVGAEGTTVTVTLTDGSTQQFIVQRGPRGYQGDQGETGPAGPQGPQGIQGEQGEQGNTPIIAAAATVDDTSGLPSVQVVKTGTTLHPTFRFDFSGLKGYKGDKGDAGERGPRGYQGDPGADGADGVTPDITAYATVDANSGIPSVDVVKTGTDEAPDFEFQFHNLKGADGEDGTDGTDGTDGVTPVISATATVDGNTGTPSVQVVKTGTDAAPNFAFNFRNLKGQDGQGGGGGETYPRVYGIQDNASGEDYKLGLVDTFNSSIFSVVLTKLNDNQYRATITNNTQEDEGFDKNVSMKVTNYVYQGFDVDFINETGANFSLKILGEYIQISNTTNVSIEAGQSLTFDVEITPNTVGDVFNVDTTKAYVTTEFVDGYHSVPGTNPQNNGKVLTTLSNGSYDWQYPSTPSGNNIYPRVDGDAYNNELYKVFKYSLSEIGFLDITVTDASHYTFVVTDPEGWGEVGFTFIFPFYGWGDIQVDSSSSDASVELVDGNFILGYYKDFTGIESDTFTVTFSVEAGQGMIYGFDPTYALTRNDFQMFAPTNDGNSGDVLTKNQYGGYSWQPASGGGGGNFNPTNQGTAGQMLKNFGGGSYGWDNTPEGLPYGGVGGDVLLNYGNSKGWGKITNENSYEYMAIVEKHSGDLDIAMIMSRKYVNGSDVTFSISDDGNDHYTLSIANGSQNSIWLNNVTIKIWGQQDTPYAMCDDGNYYADTTYFNWLRFELNTEVNAGATLTVGFEATGFEFATGSQEAYIVNPMGIRQVPVGGSSGQVLTRDNLGTYGWATPSGGGSTARQYIISATQGVYYKSGLGSSDFTQCGSANIRIGFTRLGTGMYIGTIFRKTSTAGNSVSTIGVGENNPDALSTLTLLLSDSQTSVVYYEDTAMNTSSVQELISEWNTNTRIVIPVVVVGDQSNPDELHLLTISKNSTSGTGIRIDVALGNTSKRIIQIEQASH